MIGYLVCSMYDAIHKSSCKRGTSSFRFSSSIHDTRYECECMVAVRTAVHETLAHKGPKRSEDSTFTPWQATSRQMPRHIYCLDNINRGYDRNIPGLWETPDYVVEKCFYFYSLRHLFNFCTLLRNKNRVHICSNKCLKPAT